MSISELIQIRCKNNKKNENVEMGSTLFDIFPKLNLKMVHGPLSAKVNNKVEGMHYRVYRYHITFGNAHLHSHLVLRSLQGCSRPFQKQFGSYRVPS